MALEHLPRLLTFWPVALLAVLCADVAVMHRLGWRWTPVWRSAIFIVCASLGGLALGLASSALMPLHVPPNPPIDPLQVPPMIVPSWFSLPYYAILRAVPYNAGALAVMFAAKLAPVIWPWMRADALRTGPLHRLWAVLCILFAATWIGLAYLGSRPAEPGTIYATRALSAYYFAFFLVSPPLLHRFTRRAAA